MVNEDMKCIFCECNEEQAPLIQLHYQGKEYWICPTHFPILIHKPAQLAHKLPGIELLNQGEDHHG